MLKHNYESRQDWYLPYNPQLSLDPTHSPSILDPVITGLNFPRTRLQSGRASLDLNLHLSDHGSSTATISLDSRLSPSSTLIDRISSHSAISSRSRSEYPIDHPSITYRATTRILSDRGSSALTVYQSCIRSFPHTIDRASRDPSIVYQTPPPPYYMAQGPFTLLPSQVFQKLLEDSPSP